MDISCRDEFQDQCQLSTADMATQCFPVNQRRSWYGATFCQDITWTMNRRTSSTLGGARMLRSCTQGCILGRGRMIRMASPTKRNGRPAEFIGRERSSWMLCPHSVGWCFCSKRQWTCNVRKTWNRIPQRNGHFDFKHLYLVLMVNNG